MSAVGEVLAEGDAKAQIVTDVDAFPGHIACTASTPSELVLPARNRHGDVIGVFDIDSDRPDAFTVSDANRLQRLRDAVFAEVACL